MTRLSHIFFRIVKRSSIHNLHLGLVNLFVAPIGFIYSTTLNVVLLRMSVRVIVASKYYSKWAENESGFFLFLIRHRRL